MYVYYCSFLLNCVYLATAEVWIQVISEVFPYTSEQTDLIWKTLFDIKFCSLYMLLPLFQNVSQHYYCTKYSQAHYFFKVATSADRIRCDVGRKLADGLVFLVSLWGLAFRFSGLGLRCQQCVVIFCAAGHCQQHVGGHSCHQSVSIACWWPFAPPTGVTCVLLVQSQDRFFGGNSLDLIVQVKLHCTCSLQRYICMHFVWLFQAL